MKGRSVVWQARWDTNELCWVNSAPVTKFKFPTTYSKGNFQFRSWMFRDSWISGISRIRYLIIGNFLWKRPPTGLFRKFEFLKFPGKRGFGSWRKPLYRLQTDSLIPKRVWNNICWRSLLLLFHFADCALCFLCLYFPRVPIRPTSVLTKMKRVVKRTNIDDKPETKRTSNNVKTRA